MPAYSGKFQFLDERGAMVAEGSCRLAFEDETCTVTPATGAPIAFDLGDVDAVTPGDWDLGLALYPGKQLRLRQFGASFGLMRDELLAAWRERTLRCLLLEDLDEVARFNAAAAPPGGPAEVRIFKSNLAVLPAAGTPFQWRLADVDAVAFDDAAYAVNIDSVDGRLVVSKLAKKTSEFTATLRRTLDELRERSAIALREVFPFLDAAASARLAAAMPEGRSVGLASLAAIHPKLPDALISRAVDEPLRPYFDALRVRSAGETMAGFKLLRESEQDEEGGPYFFWFFFPVAPGLAAWEATTGSGRATYFFRTGGASFEAAVAALTRGLALVNFRREPVYTPDDALARDPRLYRYAIGCRRLPHLRAMRSAFAGRAIHSSLESWTAQLDTAVAGALKPAAG